MATSTTDISIEQLFNEDRFSNTTWKVIFLLLYSPLGIVLAMIRMCMVLQAYVAASLLRSQAFIRRIILRVVCCALGIVIEEDESECKRNASARVLVSNHISIFDHVPIHLLTNCVSLVNCDIPNWILYGLGLKNVSYKSSSTMENVLISALRSELEQHNDPVLVFPEEGTTNGAVGLLKFNSWWASEIESVQPIALSLKRLSLLDIKTSVINSSWYSDYFWSFFAPYTIYTIKYLPVIEKAGGETNENFADRVQNTLAEKLAVSTTKFTNCDKMEYEKRYIKDKHRAYILTQQSMILKNHRELQKMVLQVAEVLPHVPREVIFRDLEITGNVDDTITNVLEGRVEFATSSELIGSSSILSSDVAVAGPSTATLEQKVATPNTMAQQHMSFQERKTKLIEDARRRYKEKHNML